MRSNTLILNRVLPSRGSPKSFKDACLIRAFWERAFSFHSVIRLITPCIFISVTAWGNLFNQKNCWAYTNISSCHSMEWWHRTHLFLEVICHSFHCFPFLCCWCRCAQTLLPFPLPYICKVRCVDEKSLQKNKVVSANMFLTSKPITTLIWEHKNTNWE